MGPPYSSYSELSDMRLIQKILIALLCVKLIMVALVIISVFSLWYSIKDDVFVNFGTHDLLPYKQNTFQVDASIKKGAMVDFVLKNMTFEPQFHNNEYRFKVILLQSNAQEDKIVHEQEFRLLYDDYLDQFILSFQSPVDMHPTSLCLVNLTDVRLLKTEISFFAGKHL